MRFAPGYFGPLREPGRDAKLWSFTFSSPGGAAPARGEMVPEKAI